MRAGRRRSDRALRAVLPGSPGRPGVAQRENRRRFWAAIAAGRAGGGGGPKGPARQNLGWGKPAEGLFGVVKMAATTVGAAPLNRGVAGREGAPQWHEAPRPRGG